MKTKKRHDFCKCCFMIRMILVRMKTINIFLLGFVFLHQTVGYAQVEEDESCLPPPKKMMQRIEKATNESDAKMAVEGFLYVIDRIPDNATAYFHYAMYAFNKAQEYYKYNPNMGDKSMQKAEELFLTCLEHCPDYHADIYYHLGVIKYSQQNIEQAISWLKKFVAFSSSDHNRYAQDHEKKINDTKELLTEWKEKEKKQAKTVPYDPVIVRNVSSPWDEYFPMISPDNELMFYTRKINEKIRGEMTSKWVEKFTLSQRENMTKQFDSGTFLSDPFNDGKFDNYGASTLSVDNKEMILCACKTETVYGQEYRNCDLYSTTYQRLGTGGNDFQWTPLKNLGLAINTKDGWEGQPSLSADGKTLYFATTRKGSQDNDIYYSTRDEHGEWQQAKPVKELNTAKKDKSPFLHQDGKTIYFVSDGLEDSVGGLDIYFSRLENGKWTKPKNIGYPINTEDDEIGIFLSVDGKTAYFSSRIGGDWNIYSFELYQEARPESVLVLKGDLIDVDGKTVENAEIEIAYGNSDDITTVKVNGNDGKYATIINTKEPQDVMVTIKKDGYAFASKFIDKEEIQHLMQTEDLTMRGKNIELQELKLGQPYTINDILYATNSSELNQRSKFILKQFARFLHEHPTIQIAIHGHTDDIGQDDFNLQLSDERAHSVLEFLVKNGIDTKRLNAKGFGKTKPKVPNDSNENRAKNRRTEFVINQM